MSQRPPAPGASVDPAVASLERELGRLKGPAREKVIRALARLLYERTRETRRLERIRKMER